MVACHFDKLKDWRQDYCSETGSSEWRRRGGGGKKEKKKVMKER